MLRLFAILLPWMLLLLMGALWGLTVSLIKILINAGYSPFGVIFFEYWFSVLVLFVIALVKGQSLIAPMIKHIRPLAFVSVFGGVIPALLLYFATGFVQAGVVSITIALVPIASYGISIIIGMEAFRAMRLGGIALGLAAVALITLPENSLPDRAALPWIFALCVVVVLVAMSSIMMAFRFAKELGPVRLALGSGTIGTLTLTPVAIAYGDFVFPSWPPGQYDFILLGLATIVTFADIVFIFVVQRYGPVFANQTGYAVTIAGVLWGMVLFGETHSVWIWAAFALVLAGLSLVAPNKAESVDKDND